VGLLAGSGLKPPTTGSAGPAGGNEQEAAIGKIGKPLLKKKASTMRKI
jgi:hypothetical protein